MLKKTVSEGNTLDKWHKYVETERMEKYIPHK